MNRALVPLPAAPTRGRAAPLWAVPLLVFALSLLATGALCVYVWQSIEAQDRTRFETEAARTAVSMRQRIQNVLALLDGTAGLFAADPEVERAEFRAFVQRLQLRERYPGILGIGFSRRIAPEELARVESAVGGQHGTPFRVWPPGPRDEYHSIVFLEPLDYRNRAALGYDMYSERTRQAAMAEARDAGAARASAKVTLVQEIEPQKQAGFLVYVPVYRGSAVPADVEGRRERLLGFVYSPLRADDLLAGARAGSGQIDYVVYDGQRADPGRVMRATAPAPEVAPRFTADLPLEVAGRPWLLRAHTNPHFDALSHRRLLPWLALMALATSALLGAIALAQGRARRSAEAFARQQQASADALHREHSWLSTTLDSIADAVVAVDERGDVVFMNPIAGQLTGWHPEEARGQPLSHVVHALDGAHAGVVASVQHSGRPHLGQLTIVARDGREVRIDHSAAALRDATGRDSGAVIVMRDATERLRHENAIRASEERERERSRRLQQLAAATPTLNAAASVEALVAALEAEARRLLDAPAATVRLDAGVEAFDDGLSVALCGGESHAGVLHVAPRASAPYGPDDALLLRHLGGIATIALGNARLYAQLREDDRRKDEFLATLAHELRNPLAPIRTSLEIIRRAPESAAGRRALDVAQRQTRHMVRLIEDLLDVSRISRGAVVLHREPVMLASVMEVAVETCRPLVEARAHRLTVDPVDPALTVQGDATRLAQVFANLLNNAATYTEPGGAIHVRTGCEGHHVEVAVCDNGIGIDAAMLPRVFDLFAQEKRSSGSAGGLGIGLTLVRSLVELHGGSVHAASEGPGRGACFTVCLPLAEAAPPVAPPAHEHEAARDDERFRVLVVDDNRDAAESLAVMLSVDGHRVQTVHDGPAALAAARETHPDVVLLDIGMPGMSGYDVARRLRESPDGQRLRLIAVTGWGQPEDQRRAAEAGFDVHIVKPVDYATLEGHLRRLMGR